VGRRRDIWNELPVDPDLIDGQRLGRADPRVLAAVALGAMPGALARYGLSQLVPAAPGSFPWATFWTNVSGSLALGLLLVVLIQRFPLTRHPQAFAGTGFLGAYTTFSTFGVETDLLVKDGHAATAAAYVVASLAAGIGAAWLGVGLGRITLGGNEPRA
jgi:fluoride exporter